ncbi:hypothetical protein ABK040_009094 [Willaertia magna]
MKKILKSSISRHFLKREFAVAFDNNTNKASISSLMCCCHILGSSSFSFHTSLYNKTTNPFNPNATVFQSSSTPNLSLNSNSDINYSIDQDEVSKFSYLAKTNEWWNPTGKLRTLHQINPIRMEYIKNQIIKHFSLPNINNCNEILNNLKILDVGCGGGLVSECLTRLGGNVTGIDASIDNINIARTHWSVTTTGATATNNNCSVNKLSYIHGTIEQLIETEKEKEEKKFTKQFDVVVCLEVIEHVNQPKEFIYNLSQLLKDDGILILSTMNRTAKSFALNILAAEYILNLVPQGTHDWRKFISPQEMLLFLESSKLKMNHLVGLKYLPLEGKAMLDGEDIDTNYICTAIFDK